MYDLYDVCEHLWRIKEFKVKKNFIINTSVRCKVSVEKAKKSTFAHFYASCESTKARRIWKNVYPTFPCSRGPSRWSSAAAGRGCRRARSDGRSWATRGGTWDENRVSAQLLLRTFLRGGFLKMIVSRHSDLRRHENQIFKDYFSQHSDLCRHENQFLRRHQPKKLVFTPA